MDTPSDLAKPPVTPFDPASVVPDEYDVLCEVCGYSLVGIQSEKCPECGKVFEPLDLPFARVPWLHRRKIGRVKAFLATFWMVLLRPRQFADELRRPTRISSADARQFRLMAIRIATAGVAGVLTALLIFIACLEYPHLRHVRHAHYAAIILEAAGAVVMGATAVVAAYVLLRLVTDLPVFIWKGHPSMKPTELAPIHCYAAAPLALFILAPILAIGLMLTGLLTDFNNWPDWTEDAINIFLWSVLGIWLIILILTTIRLMLAAEVERKRVWMMAAYMPFHWLIMTLMTFMSGALIIAGEGAALEWIRHHYL